MATAATPATETIDSFTFEPESMQVSDVHVAVKGDGKVVFVTTDTTTGAASVMVIDPTTAWRIAAAIAEAQG